MNVRSRLRHDRIEARSREWWLGYLSFRLAQFCPSDAAWREITRRELTR